MMQRFRRLTAIVMMASALSLGSSALAAEGYWRFNGYTVTPPQSELEASDRLERERGHASERRVSGAYQAAESGAGTVDLFFKNDDADRRVFITTMTFSFTTGAEMRRLRAGQTLRLSDAAAAG